MILHGDMMDDEDDEIIPKKAEEYLNRYNGFDGCSLDSISTYLTLIENNNKNKNKNKTRRSMGIDDEENEMSDGDIKEFNLNKMKGSDKLNEGEKKLCNILKIGTLDYKLIQSIDDVKNIKSSMTKRIGLVDPRILSNDK